MEPQRLKKWLTVVAVVYLVFPRDLIPDFLGRGLGLLDDLLLIGLLIHFYRKRLRQHIAREAGESGTRDPGEPPGSARSAASEKTASSRTSRVTKRWFRRSSGG